MADDHSESMTGQTCSIISLEHSSRPAIDGFANWTSAVQDALLKIHASEAESVLGLLQNWFDVTDDLPPRKRELSLLVKLASCSGRLPPSLFIQDVHVLAHVCCGGFSDVFLASHNGRLVAVKELRSYHSDTMSFSRFSREVLLWRQLNHPHILPLIGVTSSATLRLSLVSPWMKNGTLKGFMQSSEYQPLRDGVRLLLEVSEGLVYLHSREVIHGDLTDANVFIDDQAHAILADFGLSIVGDSSRDPMTATGTGAGSVRWMSPGRFLDRRRRRTTADDIYAFGCLCYLIFAGSPPFDEYNTYIIPQKIIDGERARRPLGVSCKIPLTDNTWTLIEDCWAQEPALRPSISHVRERLRAATM